MTEDNTGKLGANELVLKHNAAVFAFVAFIIISGIVGNGFSFVYYGFVEKKTATSFLISILAANDLLASFFFIDQLLALSVMLDFRSTVSCSFIRFTDTVFIVNSLILLCPIGTERCLKICVQNPRYHMTKRKALVTSVILIFFSVLKSLRQLSTSEIKEVNVTISGNKTIIGSICTRTEGDHMIQLVKIFSAIDAFVFVGTNVFLVVVYSIMIKKVAEVRRKVNAYPSNSLSSTSQSVSRNHRSDVARNHNFHHGMIRTLQLNWRTVCGSHDKNNESKSSQKSEVRSVNDCEVRLPERKVHNDISGIRGDVTTKLDTEACVASVNNDSNDFNDVKDKLAHNRHNIEEMHSIGSAKKSVISQPNDRYNIAGAKRRQGVEIKLNIMLTVVTLSSIFCFVPNLIINSFVSPAELYTEYSFNAFIQIAWRAPLLNSSVNPYVIGLFNSNFREFVRRVFKIRRG